MFNRRKKEVTINKEVHLASRWTKDIRGLFSDDTDSCLVTFFWHGGTRTDVLLFDDNNYMNQLITPDGNTRISVCMIDSDEDNTRNILVWEVQ